MKESKSEKKQAPAAKSEVRKNSFFGTKLLKSKKAARKRGPASVDSQAAAAVQETAAGKASADRADSSRRNSAKQIKTGEKPEKQAETAAGRKRQPAGEAERPAREGETQDLPEYDSFIDRFKRKLQPSRRLKNFLTLLIFALIIAAVLAAISNMRRNKRNRLEFIFLQNDSIYREFYSTALIVRDETVFTASESGIFRSEIPGGGKVAANQKTGFIIPAALQENYYDLKEYEEEIIAKHFDDLSSNEAAQASKIIAESDQKVQKLLSSIYESKMQSIPPDVSGSEDSLRMILEERNMGILKQSSDIKGVYDGYTHRKSTLEAASKPLRSPYSGIFIKSYDGYENKVKVEDLDMISPAGLKKLIEDAPKGSAATIDIARKGEPLYKISKGMYHYIVCFLPAGSSKFCPVGTTVKIDFQSAGLSADNAECIRSKETEHGCLLLFKSDEKVAELSDRRLINVKISLDRSYGLKVPISSLLNFDENSPNAEVMKVLGGYIYKIPVKVLAYNDTHAVISSIYSDVDRLGRSRAQLQEVDRKKQQLQIDREKLAKVIIGADSEPDTESPVDDANDLSDIDRRLAAERNQVIETIEEESESTGGFEKEDSNKKSSEESSKEHSSAEAEDDDESEIYTVKLESETLSDAEIELRDKMYLGESSIIAVNPEMAEDGDPIEY